MRYDKLAGFTGLTPTRDRLIRGLEKDQENYNEVVQSQQTHS